MGNISNRFMITALEDGTTLHGTLGSNKPITQAWSGSGCIPDWETETTEQPTIYVTLLNGSSYVVPSDNYTWYYEGNVIDFSGGNTSADGKFQKVTNFTPAGYSSGQYVPAIKIIKNLATSTNLDVDTITFQGSCVVEGASINFSAQIQIRTTVISQNGFVGWIDALNGIKTITSDTPSVTLIPQLRDSSNVDVTSQSTKAWYVGNTLISSTTTTDPIYINSSGQLVIKESGITDYAVVKCVFTVNNMTAFTAYIEIDDQTDPEYLYIQYTGGSGNDASLRSGENAVYQFFVGVSSSDPTVRTDWGSFKVQLLDSTATVVDNTRTSGTGIPDGVEADDWFRPLQSSGGVASLTVPYSVVVACGKKLTGIVLASQTVSV